MQAGEIWYLVPAREPYARAGVAARLGPPGRIRPVLSADYSFDVRGDQVAICWVAPNGTCRRYFPNTKGLAVGLGVRGAVLSRFVLGAGVGRARYAETTTYVEADAGIALVRHVYAVAHMRRLTWRDPAGPRLWYCPRTFGVRVQ